ncbi:hypothetical protein PCL_08407 [Purpureocillium lilacinum]|uniref:Methyltransferase domain-containing protein n=1 Tax=Purpureocillium lilacinum TaxID=33203 RepID=A0A2U3DRS7_PURLI|nr:hypothetical protein PCL_08407 [Purpureocillium lilacinum]
MLKLELRLVPRLIRNLPRPAPPPQIDLKALGQNARRAARFLSPHISAHISAIAAMPQQEAADSPAEDRVEVDKDEEDSTYGDEVSSSSTSLRSSIMKYEWKNGRRYHSYRSGTYNFPNDDREQDRLDMIHHVYYRALNDRLFLAPIEPNGLRVLDIGTGPGLWPIDLADLYPGATIFGNDLSPIQPTLVPPNVKFIVDDVELDWVESTKYDYIHCRYMAGSVKDWPRLIRQIYENLKPGGNRIGRTLDPAPSFKHWVNEAGFINVEEQRFKLPVGSWLKDPRLKETGAFLAVKVVDAFTAVLFRDILGWSQEEVEVSNALVRAAAKRKQVHPIFDFVVTGVKPVA